MDETRKMFLTQERLERRMRELENFRFIDLTTISPMTAMPFLDIAVSQPP